MYFCFPILYESHMLDTRTLLYRLDNANLGFVAENTLWQV